MITLKKRFNWMLILSALAILAIFVGIAFDAVSSTKSWLSVFVNNLWIFLILPWVFFREFYLRLNGDKLEVVYTVGNGANMEIDLSRVDSISIQPNVLLGACMVTIESAGVRFSAHTFWIGKKQVAQLEAALASKGLSGKMKVILT